MTSFELKLASAQGRLQRRHAMMLVPGHPFLIILSPGCTFLSGTHRGVTEDSSTAGRQHAATTFGLWQSHMQMWCIPALVPNSDTQLTLHFSNLRLCSHLWLVTSFPCRQQLCKNSSYLNKPCDRDCRCSDASCDHVACDLCFPTQARAANRLGAVPHSEVQTGAGKLQG